MILLIVFSSICLAVQILLTVALIVFILRLRAGVVAFEELIMKFTTINQEFYKLQNTINNKYVLGIQNLNKLVHSIKYFDTLREDMRSAVGELSIIINKFNKANKNIEVDKDKLESIAKQLNLKSKAKTDATK